MRKTFTNQQTGEAQEFELVDGQWVPVSAGAPPTPEGRVQKALKYAVESSPAVQLTTGAAEALSGLASGGRQVGAAVLGDEESQQEAFDAEKRRLELFKNLYGEDGKPITAYAGELVTAAAPLGQGLRAVSLATKAARGANKSARLGSALANLIGRAGGTGGGGAAMHAASSVGGGAVGGALQPTTEEGQREGNILSGAAWGGMFPAVAGSAEFIRKLNRQLPDEARESLVSRLGYPGSRASVSDELRGTLKGAEAREVGASNARYAAVKDMAKNMPPQELRATNDALSGIADLATQINETTSPKLHKILNRVKTASDAKASMIIDPATGKPMVLPPPTFSFDEIFEARKELKRLQRTLSSSPDKKLDAFRVGAVIDNIDSDLTKFDPPVGPGASNAAAATNAMYRERVVPFKKDEIGKFLGGETTDPSKLGRPEVTADILRRAPEARVPMRKLAGERVATNKGIRFEEALSPEERDFAERILRGERRSPPYLTKFIPSDWDERLFSGTDPLGHQRRITNALRSGYLSGAQGFLNYSGEDE